MKVRLLIKVNDRVPVDVSSLVITQDEAGRLRISPASVSVLLMDTALGDEAKSIMWDEVADLRTQRVTEE